MLHLILFIAFWLAIFVWALCEINVIRTVRITAVIWFAVVLLGLLTLTPR